MNISPMKILLVHTDRKERGKLAIMLARFSHCVAFADGMGPQELMPEDYDLIIVDEYLADCSGLVFLQNLSSTNRAKTIFLSSGREKERVLCQKSMDIYECMKKPIKPMELAVVACDFFVSCHLNDESLTPLNC